MIAIQALSKFPIFEGLTDDELERIAALCREEVHEAGATFHEEGAASEYLYIVQDGEVSLKPVILKSFPEDEYFLGDVYLNFEGITMVNEDKMPAGILLINDNDPPYIKFGRRGVPPSILRFLLPKEYDGNKN